MVPREIHLVEATRCDFRSFRESKRALLNLQAMPLTASGKLDRRALLELEPRRDTRQSRRGCSGAGC